MAFGYRVARVLPKLPLGVEGFRIGQDDLGWDSAWVYIFLFSSTIFWFDHFYGPTLSIQEEPFRHDLREPLVELLEDSDEWMDAEMRAVVYYLRGNRHLNLPPWMRELFAKYSP